MAGPDRAGGEVTTSVVLERAAGVAGELVLRRTGDGLEVISNGTFLISAANEASSRALVTAALPFLPARSLRVLIGGLGLGYALEAALDEPRVESVVVAEIEPTTHRLVRALRAGASGAVGRRRTGAHRGRRRGRPAA